MLIHKEAKTTINKNPWAKTALHVPIIVVCDDNTHNNIDVYFDAMLSRKIVDAKQKEARFLYMSEVADEVCFVYDPSYFSQETKFNSLNELIKEQQKNTDTKTNIYSGECMCVYNTNDQSITVYPKNEASIQDDTFKII